MHFILSNKIKIFFCFSGIYAIDQGIASIDEMDGDRMDGGFVVVQEDTGNFNVGPTIPPLPPVKPLVKNSLCSNIVNYFYVTCTAVKGGDLVDDHNGIAIVLPPDVPTHPKAETVVNKHNGEVILTPYAPTAVTLSPAVTISPAVSAPTIAFADANLEEILTKSAELSALAGPVTPHEISIKEPCLTLIIYQRPLFEVRAVPNPFSLPLGFFASSCFPRY